MKKEMIIGASGSVLTTLGAIGELNEILQMIYTILAIIGGILTFIVMPLVHWYEKAKEDGKITAGEIKEGLEIAADGIEKAKEAANNKKEKGETPREGKE